MTVHWLMDIELIYPSVNAVITQSFGKSQHPFAVLRRIVVYRDDAELLVPFFSENYEKMWCQIEWKTIRTVLVDRSRDNSVLPVQLDGTRIEGWEKFDLGIRRGRKTSKQVADEILAVYNKRQPIQPEVAGRVTPFEVVQRSARPHPLRGLLLLLKREYARGKLRDSVIAPLVIKELTEQNNLEVAPQFKPDWLTTGIGVSDEYFVRVHGSAGQRDWQKDFAQTVTPILVGLSRSLKRSADAQSVIYRLCNVMASQLRLELSWPKNPDEFNDLTNCIYSACLRATELEQDNVLVALKALTVVGPK